MRIDKRYIDASMYRYDPSHTEIVIIKLAGDFNLNRDNILRNDPYIVHVFEPQ